MEDLTFPPLYELKRKYWVLVGYGPCPDRFKQKWYDLYHIHTLEGKKLPNHLHDRVSPIMLWVDAMQPKLLIKLKTFPASQINVIHLRKNHDVDDIYVWTQINADDLEKIHELTFFKYMAAIYNHHPFESI